MKRFYVLALGLALFAPTAFVGCGEEAKVEKQTTVSTPGGTTTETTTSKVESTGENPPVKVEPSNP